MSLNAKKNEISELSTEKRKTQKSETNNFVVAFSSTYSREILILRWRRLFRLKWI